MATGTTMSNDARLFSASYEELVELGDGQAVRLRLLRPDDGPYLRSGLARMSPESRYARFMGERHDLSDAELRYLCQIDGMDHFALGAVAIDPDGKAEGVAVARFVRLEGEPHVAEPAIAVVDAFQGRGLGRIMLHRLASASLERGITTWRASFLPSNRRIRYLLSRLGSMDVLVEDGLAVSVEIRLQPARIVPPSPAGMEAGHRVLHPSGRRS
jgi:GNAT superfamily N-acetyltransferase